MGRSDTSGQVRIGGSGLTVFAWQNKPIAFAQSVVVQDATPVAPPSAIQPLDQPRPIEILVPQAVGAISLQVQIFEKFNSKVWDEMLRFLDEATPGNADTVGNYTDNGFNRQPQYTDLVDVFNRMANVGKGVTCQKRIYPSDKLGDGQTVFYADVYHNVKITDVRDDENIDIGTMEIVKSIGMMATHKSRSTYRA